MSDERNGPIQPLVERVTSLEAQLKSLWKVGDIVCDTMEREVDSNRALAERVAKLEALTQPFSERLSKAEAWIVGACDSNLSTPDFASPVAPPPFVQFTGKVGGTAKALVSGQRPEQPDAERSQWTEPPAPSEPAKAPAVPQPGVPDGFCAECGFPILYCHCTAPVAPAAPRCSYCGDRESCAHCDPHDIDGCAAQGASYPLWKIRLAFMGTLSTDGTPAKRWGEFVLAMGAPAAPPVATEAEVHEYVRGITKPVAAPPVEATMGDADEDDDCTTCGKPPRRCECPVPPDDHVKLNIAQGRIAALEARLADAERKRGELETRVRDLVGLRADADYRSAQLADRLATAERERDEHKAEVTGYAERCAYFQREADEATAKERERVNGWRGAIEAGAISLAAFFDGIRSGAPAPGAKGGGE